ncbi:MAG: hypothetical protein R3Y49_05680 [Rikenellaceae bacterium]
MKKALKIILRSVAGLIIFLISLPIVVSLLLQIDAVQKFAVDKTTEILSDMTGTPIFISSVHLKFFTRAEFGDVYMADTRGDTLIYIKNLQVGINGINFLNGKITLGAVNLDQGQVNLYKDSTGVMNINQVFKHFQREVPNPNPPNFNLTAQELNLMNTKFTLSRFGESMQENQGVDYKNMVFEDINFQARNLSVHNYNIWLELENISLREPSGFILEELSSKYAGVDSSGLYLTDTRIKTAYSELNLDSLQLVTANHTWRDWQTFSDNMIISAHIKESLLSSSTLGKIARVKFAKTEDIAISDLMVSGTVAQLDAEFQEIEFCGNKVWGSATIKGLPNVQSTLFDVNIKQLATNERGISNAIIATSGDTLSLNAQRMIRRLGALQLSARFNGGVSGFNSTVNVNSASAGAVTAKCNMTKNSSKAVQLGGSVNAKDLMLERMINDPKLGALSLEGDYRVILKNNNSIVFDCDITIPTLQYGSYTYRDIELDGEFESLRFNGMARCFDPNFRTEIIGLFDFGGLVPRYNVTADFDDINLNAIGLNRRDSISILSIDFHASGSGSSFDDFNGNGVIDSIYYVSHLDTIRTRAISIYSVAEPEFKEIEIESHFANLKLRGRNSLAEIPAYFAQSLGTYIPSFPEVSQIVGQKKWSSNTAKLNTESTPFPFSDGYYQLSVEVKEANNVASIFYPTLEIAQGTSLNFFFNPYLDQFNILANSDYITSDNFLVEKLNMSARNVGDSLSIYSTAELIAVEYVYFPNFSVLGGIRGNMMTLGAQFNNPENHNSALINTTTSFLRNEDNLQQLKIEIHPTAINYDDARWVVSPAEILLDTTAIKVNELTITNSDQYISINGSMGKNAQDTISAHFNALDLSPFTFLTRSLGYELEGDATGELDVIALFGDMTMEATVDFNDIKVSGHAIPNSELKSTIDPVENTIHFKLGEQNSDDYPVGGFYDITNNNLIAKIEFDSIPLQLLDPILSGVIRDTRGSAKSELTLSASNKNPLSLDGVINIQDFSTTLDYTHTRYAVPSGEMRVENSCFYMDSTPFKDYETGTGDIYITLTTEAFQNLTFDVGASFTDLIALNTTIKENSSFYGKAYGTGRFSVTGNGRVISLEVAAQSAKDSYITMPMSGAADIQEASFITFESSQQSDTKASQSVLNRYIENNARRQKIESQSILDINLAIDVLPNTLAQIELDAKVGDIIKARGNGRINLHINPDYDIFDMTGPVEITDGNYLFTLQTIINKRFEIEPGGTLLWTGDATDPEINLTALYKLKTSVAPLTGDTQSNTQANIDCGIVLGGQLMQPDISFTITAPTADAETQNAIRNSLNTEEALSMQFLSLMLANSFMSDMSAIGTMGSSVAGVTGIEFLSNQLSNLISSDKIDIRLGYKPQSTTTSEEFSAGVGGDIIKDVLSFEVDGNYNLGNDGTTDSYNPFTVDAYVTWNINKSGTLKLKGFTRTIDRFDETQGMQESGAGIYFKQDFNNFKDLQQRLRENFNINSENRKNRRKERSDKKKKSESRGTITESTEE